MPHSSDLADNASCSIEDVQRRIVNAIMDSVCINPLEQATRPNPGTWAVRHLPPGQLQDLYLMYTAWSRASGLEPASVRTFRRVWRVQGWYTCLEFRKASSHSLCYTCSLLRQRIARASTVDEHVTSCGQLHGHLRDQFLDRAVYYSIRARARSERDVLSLIADAMDKSKFGIPQWADGRAPKHSTVDKNSRPTCSLYCVMSHGYRVDIYISSEGVGHGASYCCDMILRSLDQVWKQCQRSGRAFPLDVALQGDNTVAELKNSIISRVQALLTVAGIFRSCAHMHLRVGHTHEDVDQLFGLIARLSADSTTRRDLQIACPCCRHPRSRKSWTVLRMFRLRVLNGSAFAPQN